ncbi:MAG TPA: GNAT family N-acetyltransferase, partial [Dokdonella sp.]
MARDLPALVQLEQASFTHDRLSARQWRRHLHGTSAVVLVAARGRVLAGAAVLFFRSGSRIA